MTGCAHQAGWPLTGVQGVIVTFASLFLVVSFHKQKQECWYDASLQDCPGDTGQVRQLSCLMLSCSQIAPASWGTSRLPYQMLFEVVNNRSTKDVRRSHFKGISRFFQVSQLAKGVGNLAISHKHVMKIKTIRQLVERSGRAISAATFKRNHCFLP